MTSTSTPPHYDAPATAVTIPNVDDLTFAECFRIKAATGIDVMLGAIEKDYTSILTAILWHFVSMKPEYAGITFDNVKEWPFSAIALDQPNDADADDVKETLQEMDDKQQQMGNVGDGTPFTDQFERGSD